MNRIEKKRKEGEDVDGLLTKARVFVFLVGLKPQASADRDFFRCK